MTSSFVTSFGWLKVAVYNFELMMTIDISFLLDDDDEEEDENESENNDDKK